MTYKDLILIFAAMLILSSCGENNKTSSEESKTYTTTDTVISGSEEKPEVNKEAAEAIKKDVLSERARIESNMEKMEKQTINTKNLREQIKQKWDRIEYYIENGKVVRIKTYPYDKISTRTEEFYFKDGNLIMAYIKDSGLEKKDLPEPKEGKTYYFYNGEVIAEENESKESEMSIRKSDAERLMEEANEYVELREKK